jgi:hypothetical protein
MLLEPPLLPVDSAWSEGGLGGAPPAATVSCAALRAARLSNPPLKRPAPSSIRAMDRDRLRASRDGGPPKSRQDLTKGEGLGGLRLEADWLE